MKYDRLVVFTRHDSAEIWGVRYGLTLVIGTLEIMAGTGVFVRVVCALKHPIKVRVTKRTEFKNCLLNVLLFFCSKLFSRDIDVLVWC
jgi:hypothetical protein